MSSLLALVSGWSTLGCAAPLTCPTSARLTVNHAQHKVCVCVHYILAACVQSLIDGDYCAGQEPTVAPQEGVSTEVIVAVVVVVIALAVVLGEC